MSASYKKHKIRFPGGQLAKTARLHARPSFPNASSGKDKMLKTKERFFRFNSTFAAFNNCPVDRSPVP
jgi:hypothetical protein